MLDHPFAQCYERRHQLANEEGYLFALARRFAYVLPQPHLLEVISRYSPLVELGAGTGYWAYLLSAMGVDIIAYDIAPLGGSRLNRYHIGVRSWTDVIEGDVNALVEHAERALFLCWPPRFSNVWQSLDFYRGETVLHIGDRSVRTPDMVALDRDFALVEVHHAVAMDSAPDTRVELSVWKRLSQLD